MPSSRSNLRILPTVRGALLGAGLAVVGTAIVADAVSAADGSSAAWALGLVVMYYAGIPAVLLGAAAGGTIGNRLTRRREQAIAASRGKQHAQRQPLGWIAAVLFGLVAATTLFPFVLRVRQVLGTYLQVTPIAGMAAILLLSVAALVLWWWAVRTMTCAVDEAVAKRDGQPRLFDIAILATLAILLALISASIGVELLLDSPMLKVHNPRVRWVAAQHMATAVMCGGLAYGLLRRRLRIATIFLVGIATWAIVDDIAAYVSGRYEGIDEVRGTVIMIVIFIGLITLVQVRLKNVAPLTLAMLLFMSACAREIPVDSEKCWIVPVTSSLHRVDERDVTVFERACPHTSTRTTNVSIHARSEMPDGPGNVLIVDDTTADRAPERMLFVFARWSDSATVEISYDYRARVLKRLDRVDGVRVEATPDTMRFSR